MTCMSADCTPLSPDESRELTEWLTSLGASEDQLRRAEAEGQLPGLAADLTLERGAHLSARDLARKTSLELEEIVGFWRTLGVEIDDVDEPLFSDDDLTQVASLCSLELFEKEADGAPPGPHSGLGPGDTELLRVVGSSLARSADAAIAFYVQHVESDLSAAGASQIEIARKGAMAANLALTFGEGLPSIFAHHLRAAVRRQRLSQSKVTDRAVSRLCVGFVDLVGFTPFSHRMETAELSDFVSSFESRAFQVAVEKSGRIVKHIGDEIMFVALGPVDGCHLALALMDEFTEEGIQPRAGLAFGDVVTRQGDYYGPVVNLASRLTDLAIPGEILADSSVPEAVSDRTLVFESAGRRQLKGFDHPVSVFSVEHAPVRGAVAGGSPGERHTA